MLYKMHTISLGDGWRGGTPILGFIVYLTCVSTSLNRQMGAFIHETYNRCTSGRNRL